MSEQWIADVLVKARDLVSHGWAQGVSATDHEGNAFQWSSEHACRFCASGAVARACDDPADVCAWMKPYGVVVGELTAVLRERGMQSSLQRFNDAPERTIHEVLALFDAAIVRGDP